MNRLRAFTFTVSRDDERQFVTFYASAREVARRYALAWAAEQDWQLEDDE